MRKYSELLPSYLEGETIRNHSALLEYTDKKLDTLVDLLRSWSTLNRPILVEKVQTELNVASYTVHINVPASIREVSVTVGDDTSEYNYMEDECVTHLSLPFEDIVDDEHLSVYTSVYVRVETYDDIVYEKSYPENDTPMGNSADHDEFLDLLGGLLGVPRRSYRDWVSSSSDMAGDLALTYPPYFVKYTSSGGVVAGTEDDWYYRGRLVYFVEHYGGTFLPALMMKLLYEWEHMSVSNLYNRKTSTTSAITDSFYQILSDDMSTYINIDDAQREAKIREYDILTRPSYVSYNKSTTLSIRNADLGKYPNSILAQYRLVASDNARINHAPILVTPHLVDGDVDLGGQLVPTVSDYTGGWFPLTVTGFGPGEYTLKLVYPGEYEFQRSGTVTSRSVTVVEDLDYYNLSRWSYALMNGSKVTPYYRRLPALSEDGCVNVGIGYVTYIPAFYSGWLTGSGGFVVRATFRYEGDYAEVGVSRLHPVTTDSVGPREFRLNLARLLGGTGEGVEHLLEFVFDSGDCYVEAFIDGVLVSSRKSLVGVEDLFYLWGYTGGTNTGGSRNSLCFLDVDIVPLDTRDTGVLDSSIKLDTEDDTVLVYVPVANLRDDFTLRLDGENLLEDQILGARGFYEELSLDTLAGEHNIRLKTNTSQSALNHGYPRERQWYRTYCMDIGTWETNTNTADTSGDTGTRTPPYQDNNYINIGQRYDNILTTPLNTRKQYHIYTYQENRYTRLAIYTKNGDTYTMSNYKTLANLRANTNPSGIYCNTAYNVWFNDNTMYIQATPGNTGTPYPDTATMTLQPQKTYYLGFYTTTTNEKTQLIIDQQPSNNQPVPPTPVTLNKYGKGQTTGWSTTQWTTIEINAAAEAHCNYTKRNAILKNLPLSGDFTLILHIQASHNTSWNWGLIPSQSDYSNPAMKVSKGDTLNGSTSIATMFDHGSGVWDTTVPVTVTRSGTTYTLEYNGNSYSFTGSTDTLYLWMDKNGSGNMFLTYIETSATMQ